MKLLNVDADEIQGSINRLVLVDIFDLAYTRNLHHPEDKVLINPSLK